jgi:uncharacterized protein involved in exopolysaccharide biosynthesis
MQNSIEFIKLLKNEWLQSKKIAIFLFSLMLSIFLLAAILIEDKFEASALLKYSDEDTSSSFSSAGGSLGGLAAITGIGMSGSTIDPIDYAIAVIESRDFLARLLEYKGMKENLAIASNFEAQTNEILYKKNFYDANLKQWKKDIKFLRIHRKYYLKNLTATKDRSTNLLTISFRHVSPVFAKELLDTIILELNQTIRTIELENSNKKLQFLIDRTSNTNNKEVRDALGAIIEEELKNIAFSSTRVDYLLQTIDPAYVPHQAMFPNRLLLILLGLISGLSLSFSYLAMRALINSNQA